VHPLVLLSVVDHYTRVALDTKKRVVGVLLGESSSSSIDVLNSFAVPFDEDETNQSIWFLDHNFLENMFSMFRKVSAKEQVIGWYSTGPKIKPSDIDIHQVFKRYTPDPIFVIIDVQPKELGIPTKAYVAIEEVVEEGKEARETFSHIASEIGALEAEEVGVEHLLRDLSHTLSSSGVSLSSLLNTKLLSLNNLHQHLLEMHTYLEDVRTGKLPMNHTILNQLQEVFNLLPNLKVEELVRSFAVHTNDALLAVYLSSLIRSVIALHNLINNQLKNRAAE